MRLITIAAAFLVLSACSTPDPAAGQQAPTAPATASASPPSAATPTVASGLVPPASPAAPVGTPVARQVLAPAAVPPAVDLCSASIQRYQDASAGPLFCRGGSIVVEAWRYLAPTDAHVLSAGPNATADDVAAAIHADFADYRSTSAIEYGGYQLAAAYYGWNFPFDYWQSAAG